MDTALMKKTAKETLKGNYWTAILAAFLASLCGALLISTEVSFNFNIDLSTDVFNLAFLEQIPPVVTVILTILGVITVLLTMGIGTASLVLGGVVQLGYCDFLLKMYNRQEVSLRDLFSKFDYFGQGFLQKFLRNLYVFLWSLLFIIPGIVKHYSYAMTPFIMAENPNMKAKDAIRASKELMDGYKTDLWWLDLTFIGWDLLCLLTLGIGAIFLNPYKSATYAVFYRCITAEKQAATVPEVPIAYTITPEE